MKFLFHVLNLQLNPYLTCIRVEVLKLEMGRMHNTVYNNVIICHCTSNKNLCSLFGSVLPLLALWISFSIEQAEQQCWGQRNPFDSKMVVGNLRTQAS